MAVVSEIGHVEDGIYRHFIKVMTRTRLGLENCSRDIRITLSLMVLVKTTSEYKDVGKIF